MALGVGVAGHKIGLTSRAMQMASKMTEPDYGRIYNDAIYNDGAQIPAGRFLKPRLEVELAFVTGENLDGPGRRIYDVMRAAEYVVPALEIIDYRTEVPRAITDTIADNAAFGAIVVGGRPIRPMDVDIRWVGATLSKNGTIEELGVSAAIMGHPAAGIAWLVNKLHDVGAKLRVGQIVLAGSFTPGRQRSGRCDSCGLRSARRHRRFIRLRFELSGACVAEALVGSRFDCMLFDTEHSPGDPLTVLAQLRAVARCQVPPVVHAGRLELT